MVLNTTYNPDKDIPDLSGKVIFITGGTAGLGKETILALAKHGPKAIFFTGRNTKAAETVIEEAKAVRGAGAISLEFIECDQTSLASVHTAAKKFLALSDRLDIFIANAGIMGGQPGVSKDGYEIQFAINYLSHALFTKLFMPLAEQTATSGNGDVRIIYLASVGFRYTPSGGIVFKDLRSPQTNLGIGIMAAKWYRYGQAKLAMVLQAIDIAGRHPLVTTAALHPGTIHTGLITDQPTLDRWFLKFATLGKQIRPDQGAWNTCWAATVPLKGKPELVSGGIYEPVGVPLKGTSDSSSVKLREELRDWTDKALDQYS